MKDPLTPEQRATVERARLKIREDEAFGNPHTLSAELLAIIGSLEKQYNAAVLLGQAVASLQPKQYTEEELRAAFEREIDKESGYPSKRHFAIDLNIWMECARFLGALKD